MRTNKEIESIVEDYLLKIIKKNMVNENETIENSELYQKYLKRTVLENADSEGLDNFFLWYRSS